MEKNDFYVYIYLDPRKPGEYIYEDLKFDHEPFYVGKGRDKRMFDHLYDQNTYNSYKINKINRIKMSKSTPIIMKIYDKLNENVAFEKEKETILKIGRLEKGPLVNFSDGGEGQCGYKHREETKLKIGEGVKNSEKWQKSIKSEEHRKKLSDALMGHIGHIFSHTDENKEKIRNSQIGEKNSFYNKTHTDILKNKWSMERKGINNYNSKLYSIRTPNYEILNFKGRQEIKDWINSNKKALPSFTGIFKNGKSKGYFIIDINKLN